MKAVNSCRKIGIAAAMLTLLLALSQQASATVVSYNNSASFIAAITGATSHDFAGIAPEVLPPGPPYGFVIGPAIVDGVKFNSDYDIPFVIANSWNSNYGVPFFAGQGVTLNDPPNKVTVSLTGFNAIGFFYGSYISQNEAYSATLNTGDVFNLSTPANAPDVNFIGFVSDAGPITNIDFASLAGLNALDANGNPLTPYGFTFDITKFTLGNANTSPVPEPSTLILVGAGFAGVALLRRRNKK